MNWFERHANWSMVFGWTAATAAALGISYILYSLGARVGPEATFLQIIVLMHGLAIGVVLWALKAKGVSRWHCFWLLFPFFGSLVILCLHAPNEVNWVERHLNWTLLLGWLFSPSAAAFSAAPLHSFFDTEVDIGAFSMLVVIFSMLLAMSGWHIRRKGRSLGHLGWVICPFGLVVLLCLSNQSMQDEAACTEAQRRESISKATKHDTRQQCLAYYQEELNLKTFQEKEADFYNEAVVKYGMSAATDSKVAKEMLRATKRLVESANEILRRRSEMAAVPDMASAVYFAWQTTYSDYLAWASAQAAAISAVAEGMLPHGQRVKRLLSESEKSRRKAEKEEKRFLKRLGLTGDEAYQILVKASMAVADKSRKPQKVRRTSKRERPKEESGSDTSLKLELGEIQPSPVHTKERRQDEMRLPESQEARTRKMLAEVFDTVVNEQLSHRVESKWDYDIYCALLYGATQLGEALVTDVPSLKKAWGKGSKEKATNLCEVCTCPVISMWGRFGVENMKVSKKDRRKGIRTTISSILDVFGTESDEKVRDFLNLDIQYNHDMDEYESKQVSMPLMKYATLLVSKLNGALGLRDLVDWENKAFPVEDPEDIGYYHDWREVLHIVGLIHVGRTSMFEAFKKFRTE